MHSASSIVIQQRHILLDLSKRGIRIERFPAMEQDHLGVWTSPDGARVAWFKDPDGNMLSVTQV